METTEIRTPGGLAFTADVAGPVGGDLVESILEARGGKDHQVVLRHCHAGRHRQRGGQAEPTPSLQHVALRP